ncbi:NPCBM/NEW2 domain-containing protein [Blastopirellula sp. JC732]|uniref:NPCBM/NEW2 domain-containing protein n=1 Tax=Blastopirellula sediminis TaxID=2894196 RepID=A0A9X1SN13_9BACT|nr:NPCBM/NEW2 domain-containing protein [Blastopirellula sediminis]MCC9604452.1 NPCBM/NEW2 domain-containing protein [Blastopirellula sediminis]MCC9632249.1 NPCBM/NEW2 domain-containing protein [Blastopirellula sediminis]
MNCIPLILIAASTLSAAVTVDIETLDGRTLQGELRQLSADEIGLRTSVGDEKFPYDSLMRVDIPGEEVPLAEGGAMLQLADGSQLNIKKFSLENRKFVVTSESFTQFEVPAAALRMLRFDSEQRSFDKRWDQLLEEKILGDAVVIRRNDDLSFQEAIIQSIVEDKASIQLDELEAKIPLSKLAGLLFYQRNNRKLGAPLCKLQLRDGGVIFAGKIMLDGDLLQVESNAGGKFTIPLAAIESMDFAAGNIIPLTDLTPDQDAWATFIPSNLSRDQLSLIYAPDVRTGSTAQPLELSLSGESKSFASGIALHARTELTYLLPEDVRQFHAFAGLPAGASGPLKLTITADKTTLIDTVLDENQSSLDIHGDVRGARRLKVVVDFAGNGDLGDRVYLCQPRLIK